MPSQEYLQELAEKIDDIEIGLDHAFKFNCKGCGNCCKNRDDIMLNGRDLYNIAQYLNMKTADVIKKYCELFIGGSSRIPIIRLKPVGQNKICPLLQGNRCIVHAAKPGVCALFPLGRFIKFPAEINGDIKDLNEDDFVIRYLITEAACGEDQNNTVRSWIESFGIDPDDRWYRLWSKMTMQLSEYIRNWETNEVQLPNAAFEAMWTISTELLYVKYDIEKDYIPQFEMNLADMWRMFNKLDTELIQPFLRGELT